MLTYVRVGSSVERPAVKARQIARAKTYEPGWTEATLKPSIAERVVDEQPLTAYQRPLPERRRLTSRSWNTRAMAKASSLAVQTARVCFLPGSVVSADTSGFGQWNAQWLRSLRTRCYSSGSEPDLKTALRQAIPAKRELLKKIKTQHADRTIGEVKAANVIGGMRYHRPASTERVSS